MLKVIVAGGRDFNDQELMRESMDYFITGLCGWDGKDNIEIVSGNARGADRHGEVYAYHNQMPVVQFPADWSAYGKSAGPRRNRQMADYADVLVAFWDGKSRGTKHMIDTAHEAGLQVHVVQY